MKKVLIGLGVLAIALGVASTQVTLFVIQPIGAVPEGMTMVVPRLNKTQFIDSADAMCERELGKVNLICRATMIAAVKKKGGVLFTMPYFESLYLISTDGHEYR